MKKLRKLNKVFFHNYTDKQMRAYFTKNDKKKRRILKVSLFAALITAIIGDVKLEYFLIFLCITGVLLFISLIMWCLLQFGIRVPTDREYDMWVKRRAQEAFHKALDKINHNLPGDEIDKILWIHGFVLKGTSNAKNYREQDLLWKWGEDHIQHYSINVYRYFLPIENQLVVIIIDVNAVNHRDIREQIHEYFFADVVAVTTVDEQDIIKDDLGEEHAYLTQSFMLRISDGKPISVTIRSLPLDHEEGLEKYELPSTESVDNTIQRLRLYLRSHKQRPMNDNF